MFNTSLMFAIIATFSWFFPIASTFLLTALEVSIDYVIFQWETLSWFSKLVLIYSFFRFGIDGYYFVLNLINTIFDKKCMCYYDTPKYITYRCVKCLEKDLCNCEQIFDNRSKCPAKSHGCSCRSQPDKVCENTTRTKHHHKEFINNVLPCLCHNENCKRRMKWHTDNAVKNSLETKVFKDGINLILEY